MIRTATNTVVDTIPVGNLPVGIAITPDGKHAYVLTSDVPNNFWVIDTTTRTVVAMVPGGGTVLAAVAVTPDGKHAYVVDQSPGFVSVLRTATNTVEATVPVGTAPTAVGIVPPPPGVPFLAFSATLAIDIDAPKRDAFALQSQFILVGTATINPGTEEVKLQVGTFTTAIPPGSFKKQPDGSFTFAGAIGGVTLKALITPTGTKRYAFNATATGATLTGTKNTVYVTLIIGNNSGATSVTAKIVP